MNKNPPLQGVDSYSVAFSPAGDRIVSGSYDGRAKIWDSVSGAELASIHACEAALSSVVFMPDGQHIVTGEGYHEKKGVGGDISIWDVSSDKDVMTYETVRNVWSVASTPDGKRILAASDIKLIVLDVIGGEEILVLPSPVNVVQSVAINNKGTMIAMGGWSDQIALLQSEAPVGGYEPRINAESARKLVDNLHEEYGKYKEVIQKLQADTKHDKRVREYGLQIARSRLRQDELERVR